MDVLSEQFELIRNPGEGAVQASDISTNSATMADLLTLAVAKHADNDAIMYKAGDDWQTLSYIELGAVVREIAKGLIARGIDRGDKISILGNTRPEWTFCDFAAMCAGAAVAPIYQTNSPEECEYVLNHSEARILFLEDRTQLDKIEQVRERLTHLELIVVMDPGDDEIGDAISLDDLKAEGAGIGDSEFDARVASVAPDDVCKVIYTSGTTGPPKGCLITHANYRATTTMGEQSIVGDPKEIVFLYLPLAHVFALLIQYVTIDLGGTIAFWERDPQKIVPNMIEVRPHAFPSVPRVFEKIYTLANTMAASRPAEDQQKFKQAIELGYKVRLMQSKGETVPPELAAAFEAADEAVYKPVRNLFGGRMKRAVTGAAPIAHEILEFFFACGVPVFEGYGMTETSTLACNNTLKAFRFGSIGKPVPGVEIKIADDGEILIRGENIFRGYFKNEQATSETIGGDGWLHTGDLGYIDDDGFIFINGRKKDIIITSGGKNLTPANWENGMKQNRWVSQAVMFADRRPYPVAVVTLDPEEAPALAQQLGIDHDPAAMAHDPKVREIVQSAVDEVNARFAPVEQVKRFEILEQDLTQPSGELTPTLKVKRNVVYEKYADVFASLYDD